MRYTRLRFIEGGNIAHVVIDAGDDNLVDRRLLTELEDVARQVADSREIRVVLVEAVGSNFCTGWDTSIGDAPLRQHTPADGAAMDPFGPLANLACPVVVAVQGRARSAGLELALACDIRLAAEDVSFSLPEVTEGGFPLAGGSQRLPRAVGRVLALSMILLGEEMDAHAAFKAGLVSRVVPVADLAATAWSVAERIAGLGATALKYAKEATVRGSEMSLDQGLSLETDLSIILQTTRDREEGVRAFLEKRRPHFEGS